MKKMKSEAKRPNEKVYPWQEKEHTNKIYAVGRGVSRTTEIVFKLYFREGKTLPKKIGCFEPKK